MTEEKLRRCEKQPDDLRDYKGPFINADGNPARLICDDRRQSGYPLVFLSGYFEETIYQTKQNGFNNCNQVIFAAEEIPEPLTGWGVEYSSPKNRECFSSFFRTKEEAENLIEVYGAKGKWRAFRWVEIQDEQ